jgi:hypothetical protein
MKMKTFPGIAFALAGALVALGDVTHDLVPVANNLVPGSDPTHPDFNDGTYYTYDLVVTITGTHAGDPWAGTWGMAETDGTFFEHGEGGDGAPEPALFVVYPALAYDSFWTTPVLYPNTDVAGSPQFIYAPIKEAQYREANWYDMLEHEGGTYTIARYTVKDSPFLHVYGSTVLRYHNPLWFFDLTIPEPGTLALLGLGLALMRRR